MKICIAGKNAIATHGLQSTVNLLGAKSVLVCPNRADKGNSDWQPSLIRYANEYGVKIVTQAELYDIEDLVFLSLEFDKIIRPEKFRSKQLFNIHFSKLPAYKGVYTSAWPILNGELESGVTLHRIDHGIDTGEIIDQLTFSLTANETARSLYFRYLSKAVMLFDYNFMQLFYKSYRSVPQGFYNSTYYSKNSIDYTNLEIDTRQTATTIDRMIRAYSFREFQIPKIGGIPVGLHALTEDRSLLTPGTIKSHNNNKFVLSTIDYDILFYRDRSYELFSLVEKNNCAEVLDVIDEGVDPNITNNRGWSPLMMAAYNGNIHLCNALLKIGANPNMRNQNGTSPLMYAKEACVASGHFDLCSLLIESGANQNAKDYFGRSVYDYAVKGNQVAAIDFFERYQ